MEHSVTPIKPLRRVLQGAQRLLLPQTARPIILAAVLLTLCLLPEPTGCKAQQAVGGMLPFAHGPMSTLLSRTPACSYPAPTQGIRHRSQPSPANLRSPAPCDREICSLDRAGQALGSGSLQHGRYPSTREAVRTRAVSLATEAKAEKWWKKQSELWVEIETEEQFQQEVSSGDKYVFVGEAPLPNPSSHGVAVDANGLLCCRFLCYVV